MVKQLLGDVFLARNVESHEHVGIEARAEPVNIYTGSVNALLIFDKLIQDKIHK